MSTHIYLPHLLFVASVSAASLRPFGHVVTSHFPSFASATPTHNFSSMAGTTIPDDILDAKLSTDAKQETSLRSILSGLPPSYKGIVMFLFPAVNTPLCTRQACKFATSTKSFRDLGYEVYGLTGGAGDSAKGWVSKNNLNYTVLLDPQWNLINHLKCTWMYFMINRSHLIISRDAKILALERGVNAEKSAERVLEIIKSLRSTTE